MWKSCNSHAFLLRSVCGSPFDGCRLVFQALSRPADSVYLCLLRRGDLRFPKDMYTATDDYTNARRLIRALLEPNVVRRLGCMKRGAQDIKDSPFFTDVRNLVFVM